MYIISSYLVAIVFFATRKVDMKLGRLEKDWRNFLIGATVLMSPALLLFIMPVVLGYFLCYSIGYLITYVGGFK